MAHNMNGTTSPSDLLSLNYNKIFGFSSNNSDSMFHLVSSENKGITYQTRDVIERFEIDDVDYQIIEDDVYVVDWKHIIDKYFVCDDNFVDKYKENINLLETDLVDEISNVFVFSKGNDNVHYSQIVKKHEGHLVAMFIETEKIMNSFLKLSDVSEISEEIMKNTNSFYAEVVVEDQPYILLEEGIFNYSMFNVESKYQDQNGKIKIPLKEYVMNYVDYSFDNSELFYNTKMNQVLNGELDHFSCVTKMKTVTLDRHVELYFKTKISKLDSGRVVLVYSDYTNQQLAIEKDELRKVTDHFTGLRNRRAFSYDYDKTKFENCVISFVDLKNLEFINEMYDRRTGDMYLAKLGARLKKLGDNTVCYRLGGDEFVVVTSDFSATEIPTILYKISEPIEIKNNSHKVTASMIYIDLAVNKLSSLKEILSILDYTRQSYKDHVAGSCIEVNERIFNNFDRQKILYKELSQGFNKDLVYPLFQPYIDTISKRVIGFESLARIVIDDVIYQPSEFIPVLESMNLIYELDLLMFDQSCKMKVKFDSLSPEGTSFIASSNLSPKSFKMLSVDDFEKVIDKYSLSKKDVKIELTEEDNITDYISSLLEDLIERGFNISIDDFSAGHSSLKYIAEIKSNTLKVDRQLLVELDSKGSEKTMIIYKNIVSLAKALDMEVVSEGVETQEQVSILQNLGVNYLQGFFFSRPVPTIEFMKYALAINAE
jgi:diguanylate cyclase (GGDEF)-like protein